jgi:hypothetical protein
MLRIDHHPASSACPRHRPQQITASWLKPPPAKASPGGDAVGTKGFETQVLEVIAKVD